MQQKSLPITAMFNEMVRLGQITPTDRMEDLRMPGELPYVPSIATYGTPDVPIKPGMENAELEQRP